MESICLEIRMAEQNQISRLNGEVVFNRDQGEVKDSLKQMMKEGEGGQSRSERNKGLSKPDIRIKHKNG